LSRMRLVSMYEPVLEHYVPHRLGLLRGNTRPTAGGSGRDLQGRTSLLLFVATYVHTSAMGVGLTSLGHLWTGRGRPHNHYVIADSADTTPTALSVGVATCVRVGTKTG
jgi:hypothetical protein